MAVAVRRLPESKVPGRAGVDWPGQITAAVGSQHRAHRTCRSKAGTDVQVVWLPDPVQARQIDQQEISTPRHGFGVSKSTASRVINHLGPLLALQPRKRFAKDTVLIVDGTLVPTRDHTIAERSKNYRYSTNHQVVIDADTRLVVVVGRPLAGNRNDCKAWGGRQPGSWSPSCAFPYSRHGFGRRQCQGLLSSPLRRSST